MIPRILTAIALVVLAIPVVACTSETGPEQQDGYTQVQKRVTPEEAQRMEAIYNENPTCRPPAAKCSVSAADEDGLVLFEALADCASTDICPTWQLGCP